MQHHTTSYNIIQHYTTSYNIIALDGKNALVQIVPEAIQGTSDIQKQPTKDKTNVAYSEDVGLSLVDSMSTYFVTLSLRGDRKSSREQDTLPSLELCLICTS